MLRDDKEEANLLNSLMASNFSDGEIDPWVDKLGLTLPSPAPVGEYIAISPSPMAHCTFLCYSIYSRKYLLSTYVKAIF